MTELTPEQRQKAKTTAANLSVASNDAAVALGITAAGAAAVGVATGVGALGGVGIGAALAVCSFGAWYMGNRYQRLANDPPRDDFDVQSISSAVYQPAGLSGDDTADMLRRLAAHQIMVADAIECLVMSVERFDGAAAAEDSASMQAQAEAIRQNADALFAAHAIVADCAAQLNELWDPELTAQDSEAIRATYDEAVGMSAQVPGDALALVLSSISGLVAEAPLTCLSPDEDPILNLGEVPPLDTQAFAAEMLANMAALDTALARLVGDPLPNT